MNLYDAPLQSFQGSYDALYNNKGWWEKVSHQPLIISEQMYTCINFVSYFYKVPSYPDLNLVLENKDANFHLTLLNKNDTWSIFKEISIMHMFLMI